MLHRVAVGATGRSPETHALRTRRAQRGRASTRPYIQPPTTRPIHHRNASPHSLYQQRPRDTESRGFSIKLLSLQKLTLQISNIAMIIDRRLKKAAIIAIECILCSAFYMVVYNSLSERILHVTKPPFLLFLNGVALFFFFWGIDKLYRRFSRHKKTKHGRK